MTQHSQADHCGAARAGRHRATRVRHRPRRAVRRWLALAAATTLMPVGALVLSSPASAAPATCAPTGEWRTPTDQPYVVTSPFGDRLDPFTHRYQLHAGVDLAMLGGPGPVVAAHAGTVLRSGPYGGLGNEVTVQLPDGVQTLYGHLAWIDPQIRPGAQVVAGQRLGQEGSTGNSTGPHLHFEVHVNGAPVNPLTFMQARGVALNGVVHTSDGSGGVPTSFPLPPAGTQRRASLTQPALSIPPEVLRLYQQAGAQYGIPWTLLAGIGMEETGQGRNNHTSPAGAMGLMQFLPSTFAEYAVDGDHDGRAVITDDADSIFTAANALVAFGVKQNGEQGVRDALFAYNHADWYVGDVLTYAHAYGSGVVQGSSCAVTAADAPTGVAGQAAAWATAREGQSYRFGADGPGTWDSSSFVQAAYAQAGVRIPRTAQQQRAWLASGNGVRVAPGHEQPGDLIFEDSYLGPDRIGFVMIVTDPKQQRGVAARDPQHGVTSLDYGAAEHTKHIFQIWRVTAAQH